MHHPNTAFPLAVHTHVYANDEVRLVLAGFLVSPAAHRLLSTISRELHSVRPTRIVLDLAQVQRIDDSGVEVIAMLVRTAGACGTPVRLDGAGAALRREVIGRNAALALQSRPRSGSPAAAGPADRAAQCPASHAEST